MSIVNKIGLEYIKNLSKQIGPDQPLFVVIWAPWGDSKELFKSINQSMDNYKTAEFIPSLSVLFIKREYASDLLDIDDYPTVWMFENGKLIDDDATKELIDLFSGKFKTLPISDDEVESNSLNDEDEDEEVDVLELLYSSKKY